jgi:glycosyltransferase involved in cell wall biosynthesis
MKVALIAIGNPQNANTWSCVPQNLYFELMRRGHEVLPLDLSSDFLWHYCSGLFNHIVRKTYKPWGGIPFSNTKFALWLSHRWIRRKLRRVSGLDLLLSTTFSIDMRGLGVKCVMLHDWTEGYAMLRGKDKGRLNAAQEQCEHNQIKVITACDLVTVLYPKSREYLVKICGMSYANKIKFICNPVNALPLSQEMKNKRLEYCFLEGKGKHVLVVGGARYQPNVEYVIQAADKLRDKDVIVDVIGRNSAATKPKYCKVCFYGYLSKDNKEQRELYDSLFLQAKCLVNIQQGWGAGSSAAEAMYKYVPVIIGKYPDIEAMYGKAEGRFGFYCAPGDVDELVDLLRALISMSPVEYTKLCKSAHEITKADTYKNLVGQILDAVGNSGMSC